MLGPKMALEKSQNMWPPLFHRILTLNTLTWKIWWAPNNASRWDL